MAKADRRADLTAAALLLFSERAFDEVSIDDIAAEANAAHGLVSYYFGGKRGIYLAALQVIQADVQALTRPLRSDGDVEGQVKGMARRHFEYFGAHPHLMLGLLNSGPTDVETRAIAEANQMSGAQAVIDLLELPEEPPPALEAAMRGCMGYVNALTVHWLTHDQQLDVAQLADLVYEVVTASIDAAMSSVENRPTRPRASS